MSSSGHEGENGVGVVTSYDTLNNWVISYSLIKISAYLLCTTISSGYSQIYGHTYEGRGTKFIYESVLFLFSPLLIV